MSLIAQKKPKIYDTAYHLRAKLTPKKSKEKITGFMFGNGIMPTPGIKLSGSLEQYTYLMQYLLFKACSH